MSYKNSDLWNYSGPIELLQNPNVSVNNNSRTYRNCATVITTEIGPKIEKIFTISMISQKDNMNNNIHEMHHARAAENTNFSHSF